MSHCPYLLHKFVINYLFDHSVFCVPRLFKLPDCSIRVSRSFTGGGLQSLPSGLLHLYDCDYEIYNIANSLIIDYCW